MNVFEQESYTTYCCDLDDWGSITSKWAGEEQVSVLDLRTTNELGEGEIEDLPVGWLYRRLALVGSTISEQDVDVFRREQRRFGKLVVVAANDTRGSLLALTDLARIARTKLPKDETKKLKDIKQEKALREWLDRYLERHQTTDTIGEI